MAIMDRIYKSDFRRSGLSLFLLLFAFASAALGQGVAPVQQGSAYKLSESKRPDFARIVDVIDGDTVKLNSGETVRLIGVDTPETVDPRKPVQAFGKEASDFLKRVATGQTVRLEYDGYNKRDRYQRLLVYLYLSDGTMLNRLIIAEGYGHAYLNYPFKYMEDFRQCETAARQQGKGLWKPAPRPAPLSKMPLGTTALSQLVPLPIVPATSMGFHDAKNSVVLSQSVYLAPTGKKYHRANCPSLKGSKTPTTEQAAIDGGFQACKRCYP